MWSLALCEIVSRLLLATRAAVTLFVVTSTFRVDTLGGVPGSDTFLFLTLAEEAGASPLWLSS